jgi:hypothetical protein
MIREPGIYTVTAADYHADPCPEPSLSSTIVKMLCLSSPLHAWHAHPRLNPAPVDDETEAMNIGTGAHALLLEGTDADIVVVDAKDWRTKAAQQARDDARAAGKTPLLASTWADVQAMVGALRAQLAWHTDGGADMFLDGTPEQTIIWREDDVWCRARLDYLRAATVAGVSVALADPIARVSVDDYKTTSATANPDTWTRTMFYAGLDIQAAWYLRGLRAVLDHVDVSFRFCVQETFAPYALSVIGLGPDALLLAEKKCLYALDVWRESRARNDWAGYPRRTCYAALPMAHEAWWLEREMR